MQRIGASDADLQLIKPADPPGPHHSISSCLTSPHFARLHVQDEMAGKIDGLASLTGNSDEMNAASAADALALATSTMANANGLLDAAAQTPLLQVVGAALEATGAAAEGASGNRRYSRMLAAGQLASLTQALSIVDGFAGAALDATVPSVDQSDTVSDSAFRVASIAVNPALTDSRDSVTVAQARTALEIALGVTPQEITLGAGGADLGVVQASTTTFTRAFTEGFLAGSSLLYPNASLSRQNTTLLSGTMRIKARYGNLVTTCPVDMTTPFVDAALPTAIFRLDNVVPVSTVRNFAGTSFVHNASCNNVTQQGTDMGPHFVDCYGTQVEICANNRTSGTVVVNCSRTREQYEDVECVSNFFDISADTAATVPAACRTLNFTETSTTCECDLCFSRHLSLTHGGDDARRRRLISGADIDVGTEVAGLTTR